MPDPTAVGPVRESDRLLALDATRGLALLGILLVNIQSFAEPFGAFIAPGPGPDEGTLNRFLWLLGKVFWEGRFYPLFSMLFGMGLVIQWSRAKAAGRSFLPSTIRRLMVLTIVGALHATLLWYGDILFMYGICGLLMLSLVGLRPKILLVIAGSLVAFVSVVAIGLGGLMLVTEGAEESEAPATQVEQDADGTEEADASAPDPALTDETNAEVDSPRPEGPFWELMRGFRSGTIADPSDPLYMELETRAFRDGPYSQAFLFRVMTWAWFLAFSLIGFGWDIIAMFCLGAALIKLNIFSAERTKWHLVMVLAALFVAVPVSVLTVYAQMQSGAWFLYSVSAPVTYIFGPLISLGYLSMIALIVNAGVLQRATRVLAAAGRMAFTNYLMQTVIATAIFYHWGFGLFGSFDRTERVITVAMIYATQLVLSVVWLRWFTMGPAEWLWRAATYLRFTPILRRPGPDPSWADRPAPQ